VTGLALRLSIRQITPDKPLASDISKWYGIVTDPRTLSGPHGASELNIVTSRNYYFSRDDESGAEANLSVT